MKVWVLAGLFTFAAAPMAFAAEDTTECQLDDARRASQTQGDQSAPPTIARATSAERETAAVAIPAAPATTRTAPAERRRNGKRIPDAQLIGPRGAL